MDWPSGQQPKVEFEQSSGSGSGVGGSSVVSSLKIKTHIIERIKISSLAIKLYLLDNQCSFHR